MSLRNARIVDRLVDGMASTRVFALAVALVAVVGAWNVLLNTFVTATGAAAVVGVAYDVTLPLTANASSAGLVVATFLGVVVLTALVRAFATDPDPLGGDTGPYGTLLVYWRALVVAVVGGLGALVGLALLVVPGLVVVVHLPFAFVAVAAEGHTIDEAVELASTRVENNRPGVVGLLVAILALPFVVGVAVSLTAVLTPVAELAAGVTAIGLAGVFGAAAFTAAAETFGTDANDGPMQTGRTRSGTSRQL